MRWPPPTTGSEPGRDLTTIGRVGSRDSGQGWKSLDGRLAGVAERADSGRSSQASVHADQRRRGRDAVISPTRPGGRPLLGGDAFDHRSRKCALLAARPGERYRSVSLAIAASARSGLV